MKFKIELPTIQEDEITPKIKKLLDIISQCIQFINHQALENQQLRDEIARLKGSSPKPKIRPSKLDENTKRDKKKGKSSGKRAGSRKKKKTKGLKIHETKELHPENLPKGSIFIKYKDFTVQNIIIQSHNILYRRGQWLTPSGDYITEPLPPYVKGHFGAELIEYILNMHYHMNVTQPKILEHLLERGVDISSGQINRILTEGEDKKAFHEEKESILQAGLEVSSYIVVDDTGARHKGKNGYCTHIGNELFAYFKSTYSKSRINFLEILRGNYTDYVIDNDSLNYMELQGLSDQKLLLFRRIIGKTFADKQEWEAHLKMIGVRESHHIKIATEGALIGSILSHGISRDLIILSDEAGQFNILALLNALCWRHAYRKINSLIPINDFESAIIDDIRDKFWQLYTALKSYKEQPDESQKLELSVRFEKIFSTKTEFESINKALKSIYDKKKELLLVLERPELPLNNGISENDIRVFVMKRKVSGGTRGEHGRKSRDTFMTLEKTCRKLGISFKDFLLDRLTGTNSIPQLSEIIRQRASPL